ncbi:TIGR01440 family protein [Risungbinella massiliensis]|uniref:TIGR01440 family protein n=1 Tax=Risungbinella massiliensis TaxID=1329796 RepID=UPI000ADD50FC|nr:TIGR01440 family protein [Risungbinella massiliensis]
MGKDFLSSITSQLEQVLQDLLEVSPLTDRHILVIGTSTSEVLGEQIGTNGSEEVAKVLFAVLDRFARQHSFHLAFQCCEHLNRALVICESTRERFGLTAVQAIPVPHAGGAMASFAHSALPDAVLVESIQADAGIDIGDTLIGMHLKPVAVPVRSKQKQIGYAHVTMAKTRPKLIGGARAVYSL